MKKLIVIIKDFSIPIVALVVTALLVSWVTMPSLRKITEKNNEIKAVTQKLEKYNSKYNELSSLSEMELTESSKVLLSAIPATNNFNALLNTIYNSATRNNVAVVNYQIAPGLISGKITKNKKNVDTVNSTLFSADLKGSLSDLGLTVQSLEESLPIINIQTLSIDSSTGASSSAGYIQGYEMKMKVASYFALLPETLPKEDTPLPSTKVVEKKIIEKLKSYPNNTPSSEDYVEVPTGRENPFFY